MKQKKLEDQLFILSWVFLALCVISVIIYIYVLEPRIPFLPCMWNRLFGIYCPGCGGTRAIDALLHGQLIKSLWYHPLVLYTAAVFGSFLLTQTAARLTRGHLCKGIGFHNWYLYGALAILLMNWIGKNILRYFFDITM